MSSKSRSEPRLSAKTRIGDKLEYEPKQIVRENTSGKKSKQSNLQLDNPGRSNSRGRGVEKKRKHKSPRGVVHHSGNSNHARSNASGKKGTEERKSMQNKKPSSRKRSGEMLKHSNKDYSQQQDMLLQRSKKQKDSVRTKREDRNSKKKPVASPARKPKKRLENTKTKKGMRTAAGVVFRSSTVPRGREVIGRYVKVKFEGGKWYRARVDNYVSTRRKRYHITYEDGDDEWVTLADADVQLVSDNCSNASDEHEVKKNDTKKASRKRSRSNQESKDLSNANHILDKSRKEEVAKLSVRVRQPKDRSSARNSKKNKKAKLSKRALARERERRLFCERQMQLYLAIQKANEKKENDASEQDSESGSESDTATSVGNGRTTTEMRSSSNKSKPKNNKDAGNKSKVKKAKDNKSGKKNPKHKDSGKRRSSTKREVSAKDSKARNKTAKDDGTEIDSTPTHDSTSKQQKVPVIEQKKITNDAVPTKTLTTLNKQNSEDTLDKTNKSADVSCLDSSKRKRKTRHGKDKESDDSVGSSKKSKSKTQEGKKRAKESHVNNKKSKSNPTKEMKERHKQGKAKDKTEKTKQIKDKIKQNKDKVKDSKAKVKDSKEKVKDIKEKVKNSNDKVKSSKDKANSNKEKVKDTKEKANNTKDKVKDSKEKGKDSKEQVKDTKEKVKETKRKVNDSKEKVKDTKEKVKDSAEKIKETKRKVKDTKDQVKNSKGKVKNSKGKVKNTKDKVKNTKDKVKDNKDKVKDNKERENSRKEKVKNSNNSKEKVKDIKNKVKQSKEKTKESKSKSKSIIKDSKEKFDGKEEAKEDKSKPVASKVSTEDGKARKATLMANVSKTSTRQSSAKENSSRTTETVGKDLSDSATAGLEKTATQDSTTKNKLTKQPDVRADHSTARDSFDKSRTKNSIDAKVQTKNKSGKLIPKSPEVDNSENNSSGTRSTKTERKGEQPSVDAKPSRTPKLENKSSVEHSDNKQASPGMKQSPRQLKQLTLTPLKTGSGNERGSSGSDDMSPMDVDGVLYSPEFYKRQAQMLERYSQKQQEGATRGRTSSRRTRTTPRAAEQSPLRSQRRSTPRSQHSPKAKSSPRSVKNQSKESSKKSDSTDAQATADSKASTKPATKRSRKSRRNIDKSSTPHPRFLGVRRLTRNGKFEVRIGPNGKYLGQFSTDIAAALSYDRAAKSAAFSNLKLQLNFPDPETMPKIRRNRNRYSRNRTPRDAAPAAGNKRSHSSSNSQRHTPSSVTDSKPSIKQGPTDKVDETTSPLKRVKIEKTETAKERLGKCLSVTRLFAMVFCLTISFNRISDATGRRLRNRLRNDPPPSRSRRAKTTSVDQNEHVERIAKRKRVAEQRNHTTSQQKTGSNSNSENSSSALVMKGNGDLFVTINSTKVLKGLMVAIKHFATQAQRREAITCGKKHEMRLPYKKRFWLWENMKS